MPTDMAVHFSSESVEWETPQDFFDELDGEFHFTLDVCATPENAKCERYFTEKQNGLRQEWRGVCWMNPPYGDPEWPCKPNCKKKVCAKRGHHNDRYRPGIVDWVYKARKSAERGATVVCLLPARTDTAWWWDNVQGIAEVRFVRGRLKFGGCANSAPFPSVVAIFRPKG